MVEILMKLPKRIPRSVTVLTLALIDQALYSLTSLASQVFLARAVSTSEFGAYTVATTFLFLVAVVHQTCIVEPMFVFSSRKFMAQTGAYQARLRYQWSWIFGAMAAVLGLMLSACAAYFQSWRLFICLLGYSVATPVVLYFWLLRRLALQMGRLDLAICGGLVYAGILLGGSALIWWMFTLSAVAVILLSGGASLVAAWVIHRSIQWPQVEVHGAPTNMLNQHVKYGRWALASELVNWAIANGPLLILPLWNGLGASALLRVLYLLYMPLQQVMSALMTMLLKRFSSGGQGPSLGTIYRYFGLLLLASGAYGALVVVAAPTFVPMIFGPEYVYDSFLLTMSATGYAILVSIQVFFVAIRSAERPFLILLVHIKVLIVFAIVMFYSVSKGITGIFIAQSVSWGVAIVVAAVMANRIFSQAAIGRHV